MDIMPIANLATAMAQSQTLLDAQVALLKSAMEQGSENALQLVESLPAVAETAESAQTISTLGAYVDICV